MRPSDADGTLRASLRRHILAGVIVVASLVGGMGAWAAVSTLSGAVVASGRVVVQDNIKEVQHPIGGVVGEIRVRDGDRVKAGDLLIRLDDTITRANMGIHESQLMDLQARAARLRGIGQAVHERQVVQGRGLQHQPAFAPTADHIEADVEVAGNLAVIGAVGGGEHNLGTQGELLGRRVAPDQALKREAFGIDKFNRWRFGTTHR